MSSFHVLIAGGGLGGLTLAQGLRKAGISCAVYESAPEIVQAGYRLHMNAMGGNALEECLPPELYDLYLDTSRRTPPREAFVMLGIDGTELGARPHIGPPNDGPRPHTAVNRRTLRQILAVGLGDSLHFGATATGFDQDENGVTLHFADGTSATGDLLVGADGINSRIRRQLLPEVQILDSGMRGMWSIAPLTDDLAGMLPPGVFDGFAIADTFQGSMFAMGVYDPRTPVAEAVARIAPGADVDDVAPYVMVTHGNSMDVVEDDSSVFMSDSREVLHGLMREHVAGGHPGFVELIERVDPTTLSPMAVRYLGIAEPWEPSRVTLLGDAIHAMPPTLGVGANAALRDAAALVRAVTAAVHGDDALLEAIGRYESEMRDAIFPLIRVATSPRAIDTDFDPEAAAHG